MARKFAAGIARTAGWRDNSEGAAWPFPRPTELGMPLAATSKVMRAHIGRRLDRARLLFLDDDVEHCARCLATVEDFFGRPDIDARRSASPVLILTQDWRNQMRDDPERFMQVVTDLKTRHGAFGVIDLNADITKPLSMSSDALLEWLASIPACETDGAPEQSSPDPEPF